MKKITIGRNPGNDIVLPYSQVSGNHAELIINDDGVFTLVDHSTNGSSVNGQRIHHQSINVRKGDSILFANQAALDWSRVFSSSTVMMNNMNSTNRMGSDYSSQRSNNAPSRNDSSVNSEMIDRFITMKSTFFPNEKLIQIKEKLLTITEQKFYYIQNFKYKDPSSMIWISIFLGNIGVDRFMLDDMGIGIVKIVTCGGSGILWLIDVINIQTMTKEYNYKKLMELSL